MSYFLKVVYHSYPTASLIWTIEKMEHSGVWLTVDQYIQLGSVVIMLSNTQLSFQANSDLLSFPKIEKF